ncbi:MAG TPA: hypothetical protein VMW52_02970 [Phycisphaerae bacterium]|nr:hypothetical protein [Phycisphaerae bacterium]
MDRFTIRYVAHDWMGCLWHFSPLPPPYLPGLTTKRRPAPSEGLDRLTTADDLKRAGWRFKRSGISWCPKCAKADAGKGTP